MCLLPLAALALPVHRSLVMHSSLTDVFVAIPYFDVVSLVSIVVLPDAHVGSTIIILSHEDLSVIVALHVLGEMAVALPR